MKKLIVTLALNLIAASWGNAQELAVINSAGVKEALPASVSLELCHAQDILEFASATPDVPKVETQPVYDAGGAYEESVSEESKILSVEAEKSDGDDGIDGGTMENVSIYSSGGTNLTKTIIYRPISTRRPIYWAGSGAVPRGNGDVSVRLSAPLYHPSSGYSSVVFNGRKPTAELVTYGVFHGVPDGYFTDKTTILAETKVEDLENLDSGCLTLGAQSTQEPISVESSKESIYQSVYQFFFGE